MLTILLYNLYTCTRVYTHILMTIFLYIYILFYYVLTDKKVSGKSKDEQMAEKKQELEKRLQDVTGQLGNVKKTAKKG